MNRLKPEFFEQPTTVPDGDSVHGLIVACSSQCFEPEELTRELAPGSWIIHRTPGNIIPPFGVGYHVEEELLEQAIRDFGIGMLVVCGHHYCEMTAHLVNDGEENDDFVLRNWLTFAEAARYLADDSDGVQRARTAAEQNVLVQMANLRTHPAVAAALAQGQLQLWGWLHDDELLYPRPGQATFDHPVALHPEQNRYLCRERVLQLCRPSPCPSDTPYLA